MDDTGTQTSEPLVCGPVVSRLRQAVRAERAAQAEQAAAILALAHSVGWDESADYAIDRARPVRIGADGTRLVGEDVALEVAGALGVSVDAAVWLVRDVVNLAARLPLTWQAVQTGRFPLWRARDLAQRTELLDRAKALTVDRVVAPALGNLAWRRVTRLVTATMLKVAPDLIAAQLAASRAARFVRTGMISDDPGSSWLAGKIDTVDARSFDQLLDQLADAMIRQGSEQCDRDQLRARALGMLGDDLGRAVTLLSDQPDSAPTNVDANAVSRRLRRQRRPDRVYVHLNADDLSGIADLETVGPLLVDQVKDVIGDRPIRLAPVIHAGVSPRAIDAYPIPNQIREDVILRDRVEVFPYSHRNPRSCDLDHTTAWQPGHPNQTRPANLGPLSRRAHRAKTHNGWQLEQPRPGIFWWTSPTGQVFRVSPTGTWDITPDDPDGGALRHTIWHHLDTNIDENGTWRNPP